MGKNWADNYKDPRWQKKRLEIMARDDFTCRSCGNKEDTLNVHHAYYEKGKMPWEYPSDTLITWCQLCHKENHDIIKQIQTELITLTGCRFEALRDAFLSFGASAAVDSLMDIYSPDIGSIISEIVKLWENHSEGLMVMFTVITPNLILDALRDANGNSGCVDVEKIAQFINMLDDVYLGALDDNGVI